MKQVTYSRQALRVLKEFESKLARGDEELIPAAMVAQITNGAHPVRVWREHRGLKTLELAKRAGISPSYISEIEAGRRQGALKTLKAIAHALGVSLDDIV